MGVDSPLDLTWRGLGRGEEGGGRREGGGGRREKNIQLPKEDPGRPAEAKQPTK
jgi:hypothetical protein